MRFDAGPRERGQATVLVLGMALVVFGVAGLAVDGTRAFIVRRSLQNAADTAAHAGASEIDAAGYYSSGGRKVALDRGASRSAATEWLMARGVAGNASVSVDETGVQVVIRDEVDTTFLGLVGIGSISVAVEARAEPVAGEIP